MESLDANNENKLSSVVEIPRLTPVELFAYALTKYDRRLTAEEIAILYAFSCGHLRMVNRIMEKHVR